MKRRAIPRGRGGFTLIEVTVAIGLFSLFMLGLAAMAGVSARGGVVSRQRTRATYLATQMLENVCDERIPRAVFAAYDGDNTSQPITYTGDPQSRTAAWGQNIQTQLGNGAFGTINMAFIDPLANDANPEVIDQGDSDPTTVPITERCRVTIRVAWIHRNQQNSVEIVGVR